MLKVVLTFGLISGAIVAGMTAIMLPFCLNGTMDFDHSAILGYTIMVLAFILVFVGIRSYRENVGSGRISFWKGARVGLLISLITCGVYVISWEIVHYNFIPDFADRYAVHAIEQLRSKGGSDAEIVKLTKEMADYKKWSENPFIDAGMAFMEIFPVGLVVTLISAAILRRKAAPAVA